MPWFESPWALWALLALPYLAWRLRRPRASALRFTGAVPAALLPRSRRERWVQLPRRLRIAALALLICAVAGPRPGARRVLHATNTIGIQLVVDCSGSMRETDMLFEGKRRSRIDLVRELSKQFVFGNGGDLKGRPEDTIGVIAFAEYPTTLCPLVLGTENLRGVLEGIRVGAGSDGTAIGDAVAVAAARFHQAEAQAADRFKSKAIVLLTDGENNSGLHSVAESAAMARQWGVRIYAIGIRPEGRRQAGVEDPASNDLDQLAAGTGGMARMITGGSGLHAVYAEIDELEKTERMAVRFSEGGEFIQALGLAGLALLLVEIALRETWLRRIP